MDILTINSPLVPRLNARQRLRRYDKPVSIQLGMSGDQFATGFTESSTEPSTPVVLTKVSLSLSSCDVFSSAFLEDNFADI